MCHITTESSQELERRKRRNTRRRVRLRERGEGPVMKTFGTRNNTTSKKLIPQAKYSDWSMNFELNSSISIQKYINQIVYLGSIWSSSIFVKRDHRTYRYTHVNPSSVLVWLMGHKFCIGHGRSLCQKIQSTIVFFRFWMTQFTKFISNSTLLKKVLNPLKDPC